MQLRAKKVIVYHPGDSKEELARFEEGSGDAVFVDVQNDLVTVFVYKTSPDGQVNADPTKMKAYTFVNCVATLSDVLKVNVSNKKQK